MQDASPENRQTWQARLAALQDSDICRLIRDAARSRPCHLVGGALRDRFLERPARDLDIVVAGDGVGIADRLAALLDSRSILLGGRRFAAYRIARQGCVIDIWDRGSVALEVDLRRRDLTIHSFALDLHSGEIVDPFAGLVDLAEQRLRMTTTETFSQDPLRILRLSRFLAQLEEFEIETATRAQAVRSVPDLTSVASERIQSELELTLAQAGFARAAEVWVDLGILPGVLLATSPSQDRHLLMANLAEALGRVERIASKLPGLKRLAAPHLASLLDHIEAVSATGAITTLEVLEGRRFITRRLARQVAHLLDLGPLPSDRRGQRWYLYQAGQQWPAALSFAAGSVSMSTTAAEGSPEIAQALDLAIGRSEEIFDPPRLISGEDLKERLKMPQGAALGRILTAIRRLQIEGEVTTRAEALNLAAQLAATTADD